MRAWFFLVLLALSASRAQALSLGCEPIDEDIAWLEVSPRSKGAEVFIHIPTSHKKLILSSVSVSYGDEIEFELALWPGKDDDKFGVIYLPKGAGRFSVIASYRAGACTHEMKQEFNVSANDIDT